jgi:hypothetical protein
MLLVSVMGDVSHHPPCQGSSCWPFDGAHQASSVTDWESFALIWGDTLVIRLRTMTVRSQGLLLRHVSTRQYQRRE